MQCPILSCCWAAHCTPTSVLMQEELKGQELHNLTQQELKEQEVHNLTQQQTHFQDTMALQPGKTTYF